MIIVKFHQILKSWQSCSVAGLRKEKKPVWEHRAVRYAAGSPMALG